MSRLARRARILGAAVLVAVLTACSSAPSSDSAYYRVQSGDTLTQIARRHGQSVSNLVRWNKLSSPDQIDKGQLLRVKPPGSSGTSSSRGGAASSSRPSSSSTKPPISAPVARVQGISLDWPAQGEVVRGYNGSSAKGITIANKAGTPVQAAAEGTVAYASDGLRGYGNMVILRHDGGFLTIYAHNRKLLVKEGQRVSRGQRIAEMGDTGTNRVSLYFEVRRNGQPVNPLGALPRR